MASMDLDTIIRDLKHRFAAPLPEFYKRRIIFWYDQEQEFKDKLTDIQLDNAKLLVLTGTNNFVSKKLLCIDDTTNNYLVYCPLSYQSLEEDWFLNIELYSEEFRADLVSIWMNEMNLSSTSENRRFVNAYKKFFGAQSRRTAFTNLAKGITTISQMHLAVMAAICGTSDTQPGSIIKAVISGGTDMEANEIFGRLADYGAEKSFWTLIKQFSGYDEEEPSIESLVTHILLTATTRTLRLEYLEGLDKYISTPHVAWCYDFISDWIIGGETQALVDILQSVEEKLMLRARFSKIPLEDLADTEIFPCINDCILARIMTEISNHIINVDAIRNMAEKRRTLAWYDTVKCYYDGILQVANMQAFYLEHSAGFHTLEAKQVWEQYTGDYYHMDTYYRYYHLAFVKSLTAGNDYLDDLFKQVTDKVEGLYTHWFLGELGSNWANACSDELAKYGHIMEVPQQVNFYNDRVKSEDNRVFVIISDALRYEVAVSLAAQLKRETQCEVTIGSCQGIFPTITKFGMAALLPHKQLSINERSNGELQVLADGLPTDAGNRDKVLKTANENSVVLKYNDIAPMKRAERNALVKGMSVIYIYHDKIDESSHTNDSTVFPACDDAINEIKNIVRIIRNDFSGTRIYITSDHGFLYTYSPLSEDSKVDKTTPSKLDVEIDRRYLITRKGAKPDFLLPIKFMDDNYNAFAPRESVRIKKKGGGLNFVHGGISLQEMVVPVITYHSLRNTSKTYQNNKAKYDTKPVEISLLSSSHKISNMIFSLNFYQEDAVGDNRSAATYQLYFIDSNGKTISDTAKIIADKTGDNAQERTFRCSFNLKSLKFDNRASYYLVIADETGLQMPKKEEFQIDIAFAVDEFNFLN